MADKISYCFQKQVERLRRLEYLTTRVHAKCSEAETAVLFQALVTQVSSFYDSLDAFLEALEPIAHLQQE